VPVIELPPSQSLLLLVQLVDIFRGVMKGDVGRFTAPLIQSKGEEVMKSVADRVLDLVLLKLFMEFFPDVHAVLLPTLKEVIHHFCCLPT